MVLNVKYGNRDSYIEGFGLAVSLYSGICIAEANLSTASSLGCIWFCAGSALDARAFFPISFREMAVK